MSLFAALCAGFALVCWPARDRVAIPSPAHRDRRPRRRWWRSRTRHRFGAGDIDRITSMLEGIGPAIAAGVAPAPAVATAALLAAPAMRDPGLRADLHRLATQAAEGAALAPEWAALCRRHELPALQQVAQAWTLCEQLGCGLAESLATATSLMRQEVDRDRRVEVATAGPRATMQLLTMLPLAGVGIAALMGISPWRLYAGPLGVTVLVTGALFVLGGRRLVRRMVRRACAPAGIT